MPLIRWPCVNYFFTQSLIVFSLIFTFQLNLELKFVEDVGLDSLDLVEFVMVLEDHFEIEVIKARQP